jgi:hypothetical protein
MVESKNKKEAEPHINYIDERLLTSDADLRMFQCPICLGVVIKPLECTTASCATLYCEACLAGMKADKKCPKRCGSTTYS